MSARLATRGEVSKLASAMYRMTHERCLDVVGASP